MDARFLFSVIEKGGYLSVNCDKNQSKYIEGDPIIGIIINLENSTYRELKVLINGNLKTIKLPQCAIFLWLFAVVRSLMYTRKREQ